MARVDAPVGEVRKKMGKFIGFFRREKSNRTVTGDKWYYDVNVFNENLVRDKFLSLINNVKHSSIP